MSFKETLIPASERHIPSTFSQCLHSHKTNNLLKKLLCHTNIKDGLPNIMFHGPSGSGKYTRAYILLCQLFKLPSLKNGSVKAINVETGDFINLSEFNTNNKKKVKTVFVFTSQIHCEIDINQTNAEKCLVKFLQEYGRSRNNFLDCHKYVIIRHADRISKRTQYCLRRIIETKTSSLRFIITCNSINRWIDPLRSRFLSLSVPAPTETEALQILRDISRKEKWKLTKNRENNILNHSRINSSNNIDINNLLLVAEASFMNKTFKLYTTDRKKITEKIVKTIKSGNRQHMRDNLEELSVCISPDFNNILTGDVLNELLKLKESKGKEQQLIQVASKWNFRLACDNIFYPLLAGEAYVFAVCDILGF
jgi:DNA polymerase III delta prime subunit